VRLLGGVVADRWRRYKEVAAFGYGLSAVTKPMFLLVGGAWTGLTAIILVDRAGKGIRTAPRDALISLSTPPRNLATAFGVHRALDTAGAMLGPIVAFGILILAPGAFDAVFVVSFSFALMGLGVLLLFVENRRAEALGDDPLQLATLRAALSLLREPRFRRVVVVAAGLALATMSDGFLYLQLQRRTDLDPTYLPLLFVGTAAAYMVLAVPVGVLADRIGRGRVFLGGYALLIAVYLTLLLPAAGVAGIIGVLLVLGAYYAATDGVLMALISETVPRHLRGSGLAALVTATSLSRLAASVTFGALWVSWGVDASVTVFAIGLAIATGLAALALRNLSPAARAVEGAE
jgi:predicted MFS family arabinose efflux permease